MMTAIAATTEAQIYIVAWNISPVKVKSDMDLISEGYSIAYNQRLLYLQQLFIKKKLLNNIKEIPPCCIKL